jgi:hypothetical protein
MATFGADARYDDEPWQDHRLGLEGVRSYYTELLASLPDLAIEVRHRHVASDAIRSCALLIAVRLATQMRSNINRRALLPVILIAVAAVIAVTAIVIVAVASVVAAIVSIAVVLAVAPIIRAVTPVAVIKRHDDATTERCDQNADNESDLHGPTPRKMENHALLFSAVLPRFEIGSHPAIV